MLESPSLLITDDDRDLRETLGNVFKRRGFSTLFASDGEEAIKIVSDQAVHVVLMDFHMPRLTGLDAICRIKQIRANLPCILISAALEDERQAREIAFDILAKPLSCKDVTRTVQKAMHVAYDWPGAGEG